VTVGPRPAPARPRLDPERLSGRVALVTGAAGGQGAATARAFAAQGAAVVLADVEDGPTVALADELDGLAVHLDVRRPEDWARAVTAAEDRFGHLDALVNNAGVVSAGLLGDVEPQEFLRVVEVNQLGVFLGMQAVLPALRRAGGGTIVNTSSVDGLMGVKHLTAYCASKFAVVGMTRVAAMELGPEGIRVNCVCPGVVRTAMTEDLHEMQVAWLHRTLPLRRFADPAEVAAVTSFLTSAESGYVTGTEVVVDGGWLAGHLTP
jgi:3alpha(or 20beta)-hydroxysteroid dehydrogenase